MTQSRRLFRVPTVLVLAVLMACPFAGQAQESVQEQGEKFNTLLYYMNRMYVDSVDLHGLVETAIRGMLEELDPHSVYIPAEDLQQADEPLNGKFEGIGVRFNIMKDTIMVVSTIAGGPSEKLGIMSGDRIVEVDGRPTTTVAAFLDAVRDQKDGATVKIKHIDLKGSVHISHLRVDLKYWPTYDISRVCQPLSEFDPHAKDYRSRCTWLREAVQSCVQ